MKELAVWFLALALLCTWGLALAVVTDGGDNCQTDVYGLDYELYCSDGQRTTPSFSLEVKIAAVALAIAVTAIGLVMTAQTVNFWS